jgi:Arm DNA-binding domain/Phage integrase, N-terminal SAM-like domain
VKGSVYKRCQCPVERNDKGERLACKKAHGSWSFVADAPAGPGRRRQVKRGGFANKKAAEEALAELVDSGAKGTYVHDERLSVAEYATRWIAEKVANGMRPSTAKSYLGHLDNYVVPAIGRLRLKDVRPTDVELVVQRVTVSAATAQRVHSTLRSMFSSAKRKRLVSVNPCIDADRPTVTRAKVRPLEAAELGRFLDLAAAEPMGPILELTAMTGLRPW